MNAVERERLYRDQVGPDALARQKRAAATKCKSCRRPIRWVTVASSGRKMPVDYDAHEDGNVVVDDRDRAQVYNATPTQLPANTTLHFSHFATCPDADLWRGKR